MQGERNLNPKREDGESYEDYKKRQKDNNKWLKDRLRGEPLWESKLDGTYIKKKTSKQ